MEYFLPSFLFVVCLIGYFGISYGIVLFINEKKSNKRNWLNAFLLGIVFLSWLIYAFVASHYTFDYYIPIDRIESGYTPLSNKHALTFWTFYIVYLLAIFNIWKYGKKQAPLIIVMYCSLLVIGIILNVFLCIQLYSNKYEEFVYDSLKMLMIPAPAIQILVSLTMIIILIREEASIATERTYKNKFLNQLNKFIGESNAFPVWILAFLVPIYCCITLLLILFGQDYDSLSKVFTETTSWHFSQKTHPPFLDHQGHYLCTVAACGDPSIVKPLRLGTRHGNEIIVNRQLLIANAFEEIISLKFPRLHHFIRTKYDRYGYPLSKKINTPSKSNFIYFLMKPLEWIFLVFIYLSTEKPEKLINAQYALKS